MKPPGLGRSPARTAGLGYLRAAVLATVSVVCALTLHGCDVPHFDGYVSPKIDIHIKTHRQASWRRTESYWERSAHVDPATGELGFNTCMNRKVDSFGVCNQHGVCTPFYPEDVDSPIFFCKCDRDWGGPECRIRRKRQSVTWFISLLFGAVGIDEMYIGHDVEMLLKFLTFVTGATMYASGSSSIGAVLVLGPWLYDVVRIGSAPVHSMDLRVSADLPRWAFVTFTILYVAFIGIFAGIADMYYTVQKRRRFHDQQAYYTNPKVLA